MENIKENLKEMFYHKYDDRTPAEKIIGYCDNCPCVGHKGCLYEYPKTVRLNIMYTNEESNYFTGCDIMIEEINKYYDELWDDYYNSRF